MTLTTTNASIGLNFTLTFGSSELIGGQAVSITANVTNERSTFNNLTSESDWSEPWLVGGGGTIDKLCGSFANAQVFQGYYTVANISFLQSGSELQLAKPLFSPPECPFIHGGRSTYFPFQPHESQVGYRSTASGDYGNASSYSNSTFHLFDAGIYTVAAGNEWGQLVLLHFSVAAACMQTTIICSLNQMENATYYFSSIPQNFTIGEYSFGTSYEGMHSGSGGNGSTIVYLGQYVVFYVSNSGMAQSVTFSWSPNQNLSDSIPEPSSAELFDGNVVFGTFLNSSGSYVKITVQPTVVSTSTILSTTDSTTSMNNPSYSMTETNVSTINSTMGLSLRVFAAPSNGLLVISPSYVLTVVTYATSQTPLDQNKLALYFKLV